MTQPALPYLSIVITAPGGSPIDYTQYLAYDGIAGQMTITQNFGRQGDTASFVLVDDWGGQPHPHFYIEVLSQVLLYDHTAGQTLFAGVITDPTLYVDGANRNEWNLNCTDYTFYADNANVQGIFNGFSIDKIIVALTQQADCGITAATIADGGFVAPAPSVNTINFTYATLSAAWRSLASQASSSSPYGWFVDENRELHFYDSSTALNSGVTITTTPTGAGLGSLTEGHTGRDSTFQYEWDGTTIHNRVIIQGASQTSSPNLKGNPTDHWRADGVQTAWPMRFTVSSVSKLTLNGVSISPVPAIVQAGTTSPTYPQVAQNQNGQYFLLFATAPAAGTIVRIWYTYSYPLTAIGNNYGSQQTYTGPNHGIYSEYISDTSLTTASMALAKAQAERQEYGYAVERVTLDTTEEFWGWVRAGYTFQYINSLVPDAQNGYTWGINDTFICVSNSVSFGRGGYRTLNLTGVRI
jgi:hypothetical protein